MSKLTIESLIKRNGGTVVPIGSKSYHFKPEDKNPSGPHVCVVEDQKHAAIFLQITEGYRIAGTEAAPAAGPTAEEEASEDYPLADLDASALSNKELKEYAKKYLGLTGTNKEAALTYAKENFDVDLSVEMPTAPYNDLVREILSRCAAQDKADKLEALQEAAAEGAQ